MRISWFLWGFSLAFVFGESPFAYWGVFFDPQPQKLLQKCGGNFPEQVSWWISSVDLLGPFSLEKRGGEIHPKNPRQNSNQNLGSFFPMNRGQKINANFVCTKFVENPSGHGCPRPKSWTSATESAFSAAPVMGRNVRRKFGPKSLCLCFFFMNKCILQLLPPELCTNQTDQACHEEHKRSPLILHHHH